MTDDRDVTVRGGDSLLALHKEFQWLSFELMQSGGEMSEGIERYFDELTQRFAQKADAYAYVMNRLQHEEKALRAEADRYTQAARAMKAAHERMKAAIKYVMEKQEMKEFAGERNRFVLSRSKPALDIDEQKLPAEYLRQVVKYEPDKERIEAELKAGREVPGAKLEPASALRIYAGGGK